MSLFIPGSWVKLGAAFAILRLIVHGFLVLASSRRGASRTFFFPTGGGNGIRTHDPDFSEYPLSRRAHSASMRSLRLPTGRPAGRHRYCSTRRKSPTRRGRRQSLGDAGCYQARPHPEGCGIQCDAAAFRLRSCALLRQQSGGARPAVQRRQRRNGPLRRVGVAGDAPLLQVAGRLLHLHVA
jgi:hypothetical protein